MNDPLPSGNYAINRGRTHKNSKIGYQVNGTYTPLWLLVAAFLITILGVAHLLFRPADRWIRSILPTSVVPQVNMAELAVEPVPSQAVISPEPTLESFFEMDENVASETQELRPGEVMIELMMFTERRGWGKGYDSVWYTNDGGLSWKKIFPQNSRNTAGIVSSFFLSETEAWVATEQEINNGITNLYKTGDAGQTWSWVQIPYQITHLYFLDGRNGWALRSNNEPVFSSLMSTQDGGNSWFEVSDSLGKDGLSSIQFYSPFLLNSLYFTDQKNGWGIGPDPDRSQRSILYQTVDGGVRWTVVNLEFDSQQQRRLANFYMPKFFGPGKESGLLPVLLFEPGSSIPGVLIFYLTNDRGYTWNKTTPLGVESEEVSYHILSPTEIFVLDGNQIFTTMDAAGTWNRSIIHIEHLLTAGTQWNSMGSIQFSNRRTGWGWLHNENLLSLYRTQDGGLNWQQLSPTKVKPGSQGCDIQIQASRRSAEIFQQPGPYQGWAIYSPPGYGFSFKYPPGWRLLEAIQQCPGERSTINSVMILAPRELGGYLVVGFRRTSEQVNITFSLPQVGEWVDETPIFLLNQTISQNRLVNMGEERAIYYQMGNEIYIGNMVFSFTLVGSGEPGAERPLEPEVQALAERVIQSVDLSRANITLLHGMELSGFISISPDNLWQVEMLMASPVTGKSMTNQRFQRVTLYSGNDSLPPWVLLDRWLTENQKDTSLGGFIWSPDGNNLFFYESAFLEQCSAYPYHLNLHQVHLNSLQMVEIPIPDPDQRPTIGLSPDTQWLAYLSQAAIPGKQNLTIRNLVTGWEQAIPFPNPEFSGPSEAGKITWSPDGRYIAFTVSSVNCAVELRLHQVILVDINGNKASFVTRLEDNLTVDHWDSQGRLILLDRDNHRVPVDISGDPVTYQLINTSQSRVANTP